ncbi:MAG: fibronectin type III domain-containing protein [Verrucomicrobiia bacterium]
MKTKNMCSLTILVALLVVCAAAGYAAAGDEKWDARFSDPQFGGLGLDGEVYAVAVHGSDVYVGGYFSTVGGVPANNIARWDGNAWNILGTPEANGVDAEVYAIVVDASGNVYVGGNFFTVANSTKAANYVAKWDGSQWSALGGGADYTVRALAISGTDLYVGGEFTTAGGKAVNYIAKWDGNQWWPLIRLGNAGVDAYVYAIAISGSDVYAAGSFWTAGGLTSPGIAKWDGMTWSTLVRSLCSSLSAGNCYSQGYGYSLAVGSDGIYVGGDFTAVNGGGVAAQYIAKWNGAWSQPGVGLSGVVQALAASGSQLYAGGKFTGFGSTIANNIAVYDGSGWSTLGSGVAGDGEVKAIAANGNKVYVGGTFTNAGGKASYYFGIWSLSLDLPNSPSALGASAVSDSQINLSWTDNAGNETGFKIERALAATGPWVEVATVTANSQSYSDTALGACTTYYYRVRAYNGDGDSDYSNIANATTTGCLSAPNPTAPGCGTTVSATSPTLSWTEVAGANGYIVRIFATPDCSGAPILTSSQLPAGTTSYAVQSGLLSRGQTYTWQVQAKGDGVTLDSSWSSCCSFTIATSSAKPLALAQVQVKLDFTKTSADSCSLKGTLNMDAGVNLAGSTATLSVGSIQVPFVLDGKGRGKSTSPVGSLSLAYSKGKEVWTLTAKLTKGAFQGPCAEYGLTNANIKKPGITVQLPVTLSVGGETFATDKSLVYTAKYKRTGTAK